MAVADRTRPARSLESVVDRVFPPFPERLSVGSELRRSPHRGQPLCLRGETCGKAGTRQDGSVTDPSRTLIAVAPASEAFIWSALYSIAAGLRQPCGPHPCWPDMSGSHLIRVVPSGSMKSECSQSIPREEFLHVHNTSAAVCKGVIAAERR